jgi:transcriptional regulator with XRE-family HTH domain
MANGKLLPLKPEQKLAAQLQDPEYRRAFVEGHATDTIAFQLRAMRKKKAWEQKDVAEKLGNRKLQPMISRYENPDYGKYSISTLLELAAAFDVALAVRFVPFSELLVWDVSSNPSKEMPEFFCDDEKLRQILDDGVNPIQSAASAASNLYQESTEAAACAVGGSRQAQSSLSGQFNAEPPNRRLAKIG